MSSKDFALETNKSRMRKWQGVALPLVLMVTGAILLAADRLGTISLDRVSNFWPMAIILVGLVELVPSEEGKQGADND